MARRCIGATGVILAGVLALVSPAHALSVKRVEEGTLYFQGHGCGGVSQDTIHLRRPVTRILSVEPEGGDELFEYTPAEDEGPIGEVQPPRVSRGYGKVTWGFVANGSGICGPSRNTVYDDPYGLDWSIDPPYFRVSYRQRLTRRIRQRCGKVRIFGNRLPISAKGPITCRHARRVARRWPRAAVPCRSSSCPTRVGRFRCRNHPRFPIITVRCRSGFRIVRFTYGE